MTVLADLDAIHTKIVAARRDARGPQNDRAIQELCNALSDAMKVVGLLVRAVQGDEVAVKELTDDV